MSDHLDRIIDSLASLGEVNGFLRAIASPDIPTKNFTKEQIHRAHEKRATFMAQEKGK